MSAKQLKMLPKAQRPKIELDEAEGAVSLFVRLTCDYPGYHLNPEKIVPAIEAFRQAVFGAVEYLTPEQEEAMRQGAVTEDREETPS